MHGLANAMHMMSHLQMVKSFVSTTPDDGDGRHTSGSKCGTVGADFRDPNA